MNQNRKPLTIEKAVQMGSEKFVKYMMKIFEEKNLWRLPYKTKAEQEKAEKQKKAV